MQRGRRVETKENKKRMTQEEIEKKKKLIKRIFISTVTVIIIFIVGLVLNNLIILDKNKNTNLVINNKNVTSNLKNEILIENGIIYLSKSDVGNFFDKYIYEDEKTNQIITTYDKKIATLGFNNDIIEINGTKKNISAHAINKNGSVYLPISEMKDVYNIEIENIENTKVITMDSLDREQKQAIVTSNVSVRSSTKFIAKTIDRVKKGDIVIIVSSENGYSKIRTKNGKVGYVKSKKLENEFNVRENMEEEKQIDGKVNLTWEYFSEYGSAPNRSGEKINGVNVVSPAFFYLGTDGKLKENVGNSGEAYIKWAHDNGYKVWPMVSNAEAAKESLKITSQIMNSYDKRKQLIEDILNVCVKYNLDGINIDFENMRKDDKDMYSRFIIELTPRLKETGLVVSVDVTAPDGGDTWSLCFNRNIIGDVADYIVFMAYDQYGISSTKPGTTAGYDWVKVSLNKFLTTEEIDSDKIILAVPLYTRIWTIDANEKIVNNVTIAMKDVNSKIPSNAQKEWNDDLKQYVVEYTEGKNKKKIWIEDLKSLKEKISLIKENKLAGMASWRKDMETQEFWKMAKDELND